MKLVPGFISAVSQPSEIQVLSLLKLPSFRSPPSCWSLLRPKSLFSSPPWPLGVIPALASKLPWTTSDLRPRTVTTLALPHRPYESIQLAPPPLRRRALLCDPQYAPHHISFLPPTWPFGHPQPIIPSFPWRSPKTCWLRKAWCNRGRAEYKPGPSPKQDRTGVKVLVSLKAYTRSQSKSARLRLGEQCVQT